MTGIQSIPLSDVLTLVPKPKYVLGTTYTLSLAFFESVVFPEFHRSRFKSCLIICDSLGYHEPGQTGDGNWSCARRGGAHRKAEMLKTEMLKSGRGRCRSSVIRELR